jgi:hypothetical protein
MRKVVLALVSLGLLIPTAQERWAAQEHRPDECVRFAVIGDYGNAGEPEESVANLVSSWEPELVVTVGDNNYPSGSADLIDENIGQYYHGYIYPYTGAFGAGASANSFFPSLGNHDWATAGAQPYLDYFQLPNNERYYDFVWGPVHFFVLSSHTSEPDGTTSTSDQANWFQERMGASAAPWQVAVLHHSPYASDTHHGSIVRMQWPYRDWGIDAVLSGHSHIYERLEVDGLPYLVNGLGGTDDIYEIGTPVAGSLVRYNDDFGAIRADACEASLSFQFIARDGSVIDSVAISAGNAFASTLYLPIMGN